MRVRYDAMRDVAQAADELGYESVWFPEHLIWPVSFDDTSPYADGHPPVDPSIPTLDTLMWMVTIAVATTRIRLGTYVYNLGLRHPFVAARAAQTLDIISDGRLEFGVGAGWLPGEWAATGIDFASRGRRLEEAIDVCRLLWSAETPEHHGEFFDFGPVKFQPKPVQPRIPISIGGESDAALRRTARLGDGWLGMDGSVEKAAASAARIRDLATSYGRDPSEITVSVGGAPATSADVAAFAGAGVHRVIVSPWRRSADAVEGLRRYAAEVVTPYLEEHA